MADAHRGVEIGIPFSLAALTSLVTQDDYAMARSRVLHPSILAVPGADPRPERLIWPPDFPHNLTFSGICELPLGPGQKLQSDSNAVDFFAEGWNVEAVFPSQPGWASGFDNAIFLGDIKAVPLPSDLRTFQRSPGSLHTNRTGSSFGIVTSENSAGRLIRLGGR